MARAFTLVHNYFDFVFIKRKYDFKCRLRIA